MIAQIQGLKHFVANHLSDVVDWSKHVRIEEERYPKQGDGKPQQSGDHAFILISTPFNRYRMSIASSYLDPPPGAPLACKSLGTVTFDDMADNKHIVGPKADKTWADISQHIHVRELTDALAAARREAAEAGPPTRDSNGSVVDDPAQRAHVKLIQVSEHAKKWGIAAGLTSPIETFHEPVNAPALVKEAQAAADAAMDPVHTKSVSTFWEPTRPNLAEAFVNAAMNSPPASRDAPWLGAPIMFITNPGEQIGGMQEIVGWCVKVYSHDRISIFMTPDHSEPSYRDNLPRRGSPAGNGRVHQFNCWDFNAEALRWLARVRHLEEAIERMADEGNLDRKEVAQLAARISALDDPLGPPKRRGRPPKTASEASTMITTPFDLDEVSPNEPEKPEGSEAA